MEFRKDINGLRAFAVASVVLYHFGVPFFQGGFVGVDIFFVISGFLLASIAVRNLQDGTFSRATFLWNRVRRIFPALALVLLASVIWAGFSYLPGDYNRFVRNAASTLIFRSNYVFLADIGYFAPDSNLNVLLHTWSLSLEFQFYIAFAFLGSVLWSSQSESKRMAGRCLFILLGLASLWWCIIRTPLDQPTAFYLLWSRAWEFMAGSLIAVYGVSQPRAVTANILGVWGISLLIGAVIGLDAAASPYPGWRALFPVAGTAMILYAGQGLVARLLSIIPLQFIGKISYSVYLWHWPLLVAFRERVGAEPSPSQIVCLIVATIVLGWASYRFVEEPARRRVRTVHLAIASAATIIAGFGFSGVLSLTDGWPQRLPQYFRPVVASFQNPNPRSDECGRKVDGTKRSPGDFCQIGVSVTTNHSSPSMMLWGDSFADALQPVVDITAKELGLSGIVATQGGCPPFRGKVFKGSGAEIFSGCEKYANFVFDYFKKTPAITLVIAAGDWQRYDADYEGGVLKEIAEILAKRGGHMVLVGATPNPQGDVPRQWARKQFQAGRAISEMAIPRTTQADLLNHVGRIVSIATQPGNVTVVEPFDALCATDVCYAVKHGRALFMDTDHLSLEGISYITPMLVSALGDAASKIHHDLSADNSLNEARRKNLAKEDVFSID